MYGQTGSGKTMSLGQLQRLAASQLFAETRAAAPCDDGQLAAPHAVEAVEVTAVEVQGRRCFDLYGGGECTVLQTAQGGAVLKGTRPYVATSAAALQAHLARVLHSRTT